MPRVVQDELRARAAGVPDWLPICKVTDAAAVAGIAVAGAARVGGAAVYKAHLGNSVKKAKDAIIAATAHADADIFVSEDPRCRGRANMHTRCECFSYSEFLERLRLL
jgi:hypothetical protein